MGSIRPPPGRPAIPPGGGGTAGLPGVPGVPGGAPGGGIPAADGGALPPLPPPVLVPLGVVAPGVPPVAVP